MQLHKIILEMQGVEDYNLVLTRLVQSEGIADPYQIYVLSLLTQFFKDGLKSASQNLEGPLPYSNAATSTAAIEAIKSLSASDKVNLAQYLIDCLAAGECALHDQQQSSADWIRYVLRRQ